MPVVAKPVVATPFEQSLQPSHVGFADILPLCHVLRMLR